MAKGNGEGKGEGGKVGNGAGAEGGKVEGVGEAAVVAPAVVAATAAPEPTETTTAEAVEEGDDSAAATAATVSAAAATATTTSHSPAKEGEDEAVEGKEVEEEAATGAAAAVTVASSSALPPPSPSKKGEVGAVEDGKGDDARADENKAKAKSEDGSEGAGESKPTAATDDDDEGTYHACKLVDFLGRTCPVLMQNENGPCPLLALCNVLLLRGTLKLDVDISSGAPVHSSHLVKLLANLLFDANQQDSKRYAAMSGGERANQARALEVG